MSVSKHLRFIWNPNTNCVDVSPRSKLCPEAFFRNCKSYSIGNHESVSASMTKVFDQICSAYKPSRIQKANTVEGMLDLEEAKQLESLTCVKMTVDHPFHSTIPTTAPTEPIPNHLRDLANYHLTQQGIIQGVCSAWPEKKDCGHPSCNRASLMLDDDAKDDEGRYSPLYLAGHAFVSGGTASGVVEALSRSCRSRIVPTMDPKIFTAAYLHTASKIPPMTKIPDFKPETFDEVPKRPTKSAGYLPVRQDFYEYENCIIKYVNTAKQGEAYEYSFKELNKLVDVVREGIKKEKVVPSSWFPTFISKISVKPEIRTAGSNVSKTRIIYITCLIYLMLDTVLFKEYVKNSYQRNGCMIGHQWKKGGATHLANYLGWARKDMCYAIMDVEHFDQSALAAIIELIITMPLLTLVDDGSVEYKMCVAFMTERAHHMACKIAKWEGDEYRLIIGQVFSGLFLTSWLDTIYMILCVTAAFTCIYHDMKKVNPKRAQRFKYAFIRRLQYGDNSLYGFPLEFLEDICGGRTPERPLGRLQDLLETMVGMKLKPEETHLYLPDDSGVSPLFTILKPVYDSSRRIVRYEIVRHGPEFLKRKFILMSYHGKTHIMPWRCEDDFYTRSCISANFGPYNRDKWTSKYIGLMVDTMGTNDVAYNTMRHMFLGSLQGADTLSIGQKVQLYLNSQPKLYELDEVEPEPCISEDTLNKAIAKTGLLREEVMTLALDKKRLMEEFIYDDEWRKTWARDFKLNLYNPDGSIRKDANFDVNWHQAASLEGREATYTSFEWPVVA